MMTDLQSTGSRTLREMADDLKADAKRLQHSNRTEALRLFRLFRQITQELHGRHNSATAHKWN